MERSLTGSDKIADSREIPDAITMLEQSCNVLNSRIGELRERIGPSLVASPPKQEEATVSGFSCHIAAQISDLNQSVQSSIEQISDLIDTCQL